MVNVQTEYALVLDAFYSPLSLAVADHRRPRRRGIFHRGNPTCSGVDGKIIITIIIQSRNKLIPSPSLSAVYKQSPGLLPLPLILLFIYLTRHPDRSTKLLTTDCPDGATNGHPRFNNNNSAGDFSPFRLLNLFDSRLLESRPS